MALVPLHHSAGCKVDYVGYDIGFALIFGLRYLAMPLLCICVFVKRCQNTLFEWSLITMVIYYEIAFTFVPDIHFLRLVLSNTITVGVTYVIF